MFLALWFRWQEVSTPMPNIEVYVQSAITGWVRINLSRRRTPEIAWSCSAFQDPSSVVLPPFLLVVDPRPFCIHPCTLLLKPSIHVALSKKWGNRATLNPVVDDHFPHWNRQFAADPHFQRSNSPVSGKHEPSSFSRGSASPDLRQSSTRSRCFAPSTVLHQRTCHDVSDLRSVPQ